MALYLERSILAALGLAIALAGCASGPMIEGMPAGLGLPAEAPARPATAYEYPAVHDMPPPRAIPTMTEEQQLTLENELILVRDRQEAKEGTAKKPTPPAKKKPATAENAETAGAKTNP
jgi:hypothetical protein